VATSFDRVETKGLVKMFGVTPVLRGIDLELRAGAITAIMGPNGSGKSTLLAILAGLVQPTDGVVRFGNGAPGEVPREAIGVLAHAPLLYPDLTARENLLLFAALHETPKPDEVVARALARFDATKLADRLVRAFSRGQLQRIAIARALLHEPKLVLLDEPSTGLDRDATALLRETIREERARGAIVAVVTHDDAFVDGLADVRHHLVGGRFVEAAA
jgi:heme exporter protein A